MIRTVAKWTAARPEENVLNFSLQTLRWRPTKRLEYIERHENTSDLLFYVTLQSDWPYSQSVSPCDLSSVRQSVCLTDCQSVWQTVSQSVIQSVGASQSVSQKDNQSISQSVWSITHVCPSIFFYNSVPHTRKTLFSPELLHRIFCAKLIRARVKNNNQDGSSIRLRLLLIVIRAISIE